MACLWRVGFSKHRMVTVLAKLLCIWCLGFVPGDVVNDSVLFRCCHSYFSLVVTEQFIKEEVQYGAGSGELEPDHLDS